MFSFVRTSPPLQELPRYAAVRKINELVKRARMARVHSLIIGHLRGQMPFFGQEKAQKKVRHVALHCSAVQRSLYQRFVWLACNSERGGKRLRYSV